MKSVLIHKIVVPGIPKAQPRPRMTKTGHVYTPDSAKAWKEAIMTAFLYQYKQKIAQPVRLRVLFNFPFPKKSKNKGAFPHIKKPDTDNLLKAVMDSITEAGVWEDDALVYSIYAEKRYYGGVCGSAEITIEALEKEEGE